jgi:vanillate O-demethylase monooxygenase subunit
VLRDELELLRRLWFPVARVEDVGHERPAAAELLDTKLVVYRGSGPPTVATDRCPHRGSKLSMGRMVNGAIECPYHGWRFSSDGNCVCVPSQPEAGPHTILGTWPTVEKYGLIWTCLGPPLIPVPSLPLIDQADHESTKEIAQGAPFDVRCGLRTVTENFFDSSHFAFVHPVTIAPETPIVPSFTVERNGWTLSWEFPFTVLDADEALLSYEVTLPSVAQFAMFCPDGAWFVLVQVVTPLGTQPVRSRSFWFVAANPAYRERHRGLAEEVAYQATVFAEDVPVIESLDPPEVPLRSDEHVHVRADRNATAYRRLFRELLQLHRQQPVSNAIVDADVISEPAQARRG